MVESLGSTQMNRDDIIRMAREAGGSTDDPSDLLTIANLERFAALVAAAEREACQRVHDLLEVHQAALEASEKPGPWPAKEVIAKAVAAEREACARMAEECVDIERLADDIRARGE